MGNNIGFLSGAFIALALGALFVFAKPQIGMFTPEEIYAIGMFLLGLSSGWSSSSWK